MVYKVIAEHTTRLGEVVEVAYEFDARSLLELRSLCSEHGLFGDRPTRIERRIGSHWDQISWA